MSLVSLSIATTAAKERGRGDCHGEAYHVHWPSSRPWSPPPPPLQQRLHREGGMRRWPRLTSAGHRLVPPLPSHCNNGCKGEGTRRWPRRGLSRPLQRGGDGHRPSSIVSSLLSLPIATTAANGRGRDDCHGEAYHVHCKGEGTAIVHRLLPPLPPHCNNVCKWEGTRRWPRRGLSRPLAIVSLQRGGRPLSPLSSPSPLQQRLQRGGNETMHGHGKRRGLSCPLNR